jgi:hypothetical protein
MGVLVIVVVIVAVIVAVVVTVIVVVPVVALPHRLLGLGLGATEHALQLVEKTHRDTPLGVE